MCATRLGKTMIYWYLAVARSVRTLMHCVVAVHAYIYALDCRASEGVTLRLRASGRSVSACQCKCNGLPVGRPAEQQTPALTIAIIQICVDW